jgi:DDE superfamily endonuclease
VREVARRDKEARFTALLHHVNLDRLRAAYRAIRPTAAPGVDGVTWEAYGQNLEVNLQDLSARLRAGRYRARAPAGRTSRRRTGGNGRSASPRWKKRALIPTCNWRHRRDLHSGHRKRYGVNVQIVCDLYGRVNACTHAFPGSWHDSAVSMRRVW